MPSPAPIIGKRARHDEPAPSSPKTYTEKKDGAEERPLKRRILCDDAPAPATKADELVLNIRNLKATPVSPEVKVTPKRIIKQKSPVSVSRQHLPDPIDIEYNWAFQGELQTMKAKLDSELYTRPTVYIVKSRERPTRKAASAPSNYVTSDPSNTDATKNEALADVEEAIKEEGEETLKNDRVFNPMNTRYKPDGDGDICITKRQHYADDDLSEGDLASDHGDEPGQEKKTADTEEKTADTKAKCAGEKERPTGEEEKTSDEEQASVDAMENAANDGIRFDHAAFTGERTGSYSGDTTKYGMSRLKPIDGVYADDDLSDGDLASDHDNPAEEPADDSSYPTPPRSDDKTSPSRPCPVQLSAAAKHAASKLARSQPCPVPSTQAEKGAAAKVAVPHKVIYQSTGLQTLPPGNNHEYEIIHGKKARHGSSVLYDITYTIPDAGLAAMGRFGIDTPVHQPTGLCNYDLMYGREFEAPQPQSDFSTEEHCFQTMTPKERNDALITARARAIGQIMKARPHADRQGYKIIVEPAEKLVAHSEQYRIKVQIDADGKVDIPAPFPNLVLVSQTIPALDTDSAELASIRSEDTLAGHDDDAYVVRKVNDKDVYTGTEQFVVRMIPAPPPPRRPLSPPACSRKRKADSESLEDKNPKRPKLSPPPQPAGSRKRKADSEAPEDKNPKRLKPQNPEPNTPIIQHPDFTITGHTITTRRVFGGPVAVEKAPAPANRRPKESGEALQSQLRAGHFKHAVAAPAPAAAPGQSLGAPRPRRAPRKAIEPYIPPARR